MTKRKNISKVLEKARARLAGMKAIDESLDLGNGLSVSTVQTNVDDVVSTMELYNKTLAQADELANQVESKEKALGDLVERCLSGVAARYGKNSDEYEKAGGTKKSERKRKQPKKEA